MTRPPYKRGKLCERLAAWPTSRASASAKQVSTFVGFLKHVSFTIRPGSLIVQCMLASVGLPRIVAVADFACRTANPGRWVVIGPEVHGDLEFWRWFTAEGLHVRGGCWSAPMYHSFEHPARVLCFRMLPKRRSGASSSNLEYTGDMSSIRRTVSFLQLEYGCCGRERYSHQRP